MYIFEHKSGILTKAYVQEKERREKNMLVKCNLSTLMGKYRYSIQDVHEKTGLARATISNLYNDKATRIDYDTIARLCDLFQCDVQSLLMMEKTTKDDAKNASNKMEELQ